MFDDIVKALTIKVTADDLTGGAWSEIGKGVKGVMSLATPFNQAWELTSKIVDTAAAAMEKPIQWLSDGGELSETRAGVDALGRSFGVNAASMLKSIRDLSDGTLSITKAMQATGNAIRQGFSEEQTRSIWSFAQKFVDTMGDQKGGVLEVAENIEKAIFTGKGRGAKEFGLNIAIGTSFADIEEQMRKLKESMGDGAFNFGDSLEKMATAAEDSALRIKEELNDLLGSLGFDGLTDWFMSSMQSVEQYAPEIATAMFKPIADAIDIGADLLSEFFNFFGDLTGTAFSEADTLGMKIMTVISGIGNTGYDVIEFIIDGMNYVLEPLNAITKGLFTAQTALLEFQLSAKKSVFGASEDEIKRLEMSISESKILAGSGIFTIDKSGIEARQKAYNDGLLKITETAGKTSEAHKKMGKGILKAGEAFENAIDKEKEAKEKTRKVTGELVKTNNDLAKSYAEVEKAAMSAFAETGKGIAEGMKAVAQVETETTRGINESVQGLMGLAAAGKENTLAWYSAKKLLDQQQADKRREQELLEQQAAAQNRLADALEEYSRTPKEIIFTAPNNPNTAEMLLQFIIDWLVEQARAEGTVIQA